MSSVHCLFQTHGRLHFSSVKLLILRFWIENCLQLTVEFLPKLDRLGFSFNRDSTSFINIIISTGNISSILYFQSYV